ncbi:MAG: 3-isopropylmalate dehydratase small subunit, partial [Pseudomonadota bacterium]
MPRQPFQTFTGLSAPLDRASVDTDQIIPKQYLTGTERNDLDVGLFNDWRYHDGDPSRPNPEFILNMPRYQGATVLVAGENFGCGSSR